MIFNKKTIATLALAGLSFGAAKAQSNTHLSKPSHIINATVNTEPQTTDELGNKTSLIGAGIGYGKDFAVFPLNNRWTIEYLWQAGLDINKIHSENTRPDLSRQQSDIDITQIKASVALVLGFQFKINGNFGLGIRMPLGVGLNTGVANGSYNWETGDFGIYKNHFLVRPCFFTEPQLFIKRKNLEAFGGCRISTGPIGKTKLNTGEKVFNEAGFHLNNQMHFMAGLRLYLKSKGK
ncbi:MAG: hypothetical protein LBJ73_03130 [Rickettsiales bacterium]|jgi:hypothetical protein|nr:hypothetical protein [Rickettsiales bacterium]